MSFPLRHSTCSNPTTITYCDLIASLSYFLLEAHVHNRKVFEKNGPVQLSYKFIKGCGLIVQQDLFHERPELYKRRGY